MRREFEDGGGGVHMALHEMTTHLRASTESGFEVHFGTGRKVADVRYAEGFRKEIKGEAVAFERGDGEAATVDGDAVADL